MSIDARLEHNLSLSNLVNAESLGNLCEEFRQLADCPIQVTNRDGGTLHGESVFRLGCTEHASSCPACRPEGPRFEEDADKVGSVACRSGKTYLRVRIENQFDTVGYILMGPLPGAGKPNGAAVTTLPAQKLLQFLATVLDEIVFAKYQSYLVSKMNLQSYADNLGELLDKDGELQKYEETLKESKELRSLF